MGLLWFVGFPDFYCFVCHGTCDLRQVPEPSRFDPLKEGMQRNVFGQLGKILNQMVKVMQLKKCKPIN
jgi:hypothetical protein